MPTFIKTERSCGTPGLPKINWTEWTYHHYKIVRYHDGEYYAYYKGSNNSANHVCTPPDLVPCQGCGDPYCDGWHRAWSDLDSAQEACLRHATDLS